MRASRGPRRTRSQHVGRVLRALAPAVALLLSAAAASACPSCPIGEAARQQVLDQDFGTNLVIAVAPFLLIGIVSRWAEGVGRRQTRQVRG